MSGSSTTANNNDLPTTEPQHFIGKLPPQTNRWVLVCKCVCVKALMIKAAVEQVQAQYVKNVRSSKARRRGKFVLLSQVWKGSTPSKTSSSGINWTHTLTHFRPVTCGHLDQLGCVRACTRLPQKARDIFSNRKKVSCWLLSTITIITPPSVFSAEPHYFWHTVSCTCFLLNKQIKHIWT